MKRSSWPSGAEPSPASRSLPSPSPACLSCTMDMERGFLRPDPTNKSSSFRSSGLGSVPAWSRCSRNPAVIADLVGDNVGDCAGRGADLFESTAAENIGAMVLGVLLFPLFGVPGIIFPLVARGFGVLACVVGVYVVKAREEESPMAALNRGYLVATVLAAILFGVAAWAMLQPPASSGAASLTWIRYWACGIAGMITAFLYVWITQYYTEAKYRPVKEIARASETGPATNIIAGFSVGLEATWLPIIVVSGALLISYALGQSTRISDGGLYGTAIATMGMLSTAAYILAMDTFGPIVDNGAGIIEMSGM